MKMNKTSDLSTKQQSYARHNTLNEKHRSVVSSDNAKGKLSPKLEAIRARGVMYAKSK